MMETRPRAQKHIQNSKEWALMLHTRPSQQPQQKQNNKQKRKPSAKKALEHFEYTEVDEAKMAANTVQGASHGIT